MRHTSPSRPGHEFLLKRLAGRFMSQNLEAGKPLWQIRFGEGPEGPRGMRVFSLEFRAMLPVSVRSREG